MMPTSRRQAMAIGAGRYFTGKPCKHGHVAERQTIGANCCACREEYYSANVTEVKRRASQWNAENKERRSEIQKASNKRCAAKLQRDRRDRYASADKDALRRVQSDWRKRNPEKRRAKEARYRDAHRKAMRAKWAAKNARRKGAVGSFTKTEIDCIRQRQRNRCGYCRASLRNVKEHRDHIIPIALGGSNLATNIQLLCEPCNLSKGAKHPIEHARSLGRLL